MKRVRDAMQEAVETIAGHEPLPVGARQLCDCDLRLLVVISDEGHAIATLTDRDIVRVVASGQDPTRQRVADISGAKLYSVAPDDDIDVAISLMGEQGIRRLPVCRDGELVGIISLEDLVPDHLQADGIRRAMARRPAATERSPRLRGLHRGLRALHRAS